jgi:hypothetical protein
MNRKDLISFVVGLILMIVSRLVLQDVGVGIAIASVGGVFAGRWIERSL